MKTRPNHPRTQIAGFTLIETMIVVLIIGVLLAMAAPNFIKARETTRVKSCMANLKAIGAAKEQWAMDFRKDANDTPVQNDLTTEGASAGKYLKQWPQCPDSGTYTIGQISQQPTCDIAGHAL